MPRKQPKLILAAYRAAEARRIVANQRGLIAMLKSKGEPTVEAEGMLEVYLSSLKRCESTASALISDWAEGAANVGVPEMCDFSLQSVRSRPAKVGDKLVTCNFGTGTRGFAAADDLGLAVCVMPGTELAFAGEVACLPTGLLGWKTKTINHQTAIFRQVNKDKVAAHYDALEFPDGRTVLLTHLCEGQAATVLQLPAQPATATEADAQKRVTYVG